MLSPQLERVLIENLAALEESINAKGDRQFENTSESYGPKSVRMYQHDRKLDSVNNEVYHMRKMQTNTIRELSCESNSVEPSPKSQQSPPYGVSPSDRSPILSQQTPASVYIKKNNPQPTNFRDESQRCIDNLIEDDTEKLKIDLADVREKPRRCVDDFNSSSSEF